LKKVSNFFFRKKEGKKARSFHHPTTILKAIFSNYDIKEFSAVKKLSSPSATSHALQALLPLVVGSVNSD
jgi:hypothetical protein